MALRSPVLFLIIIASNNFLPTPPHADRRRHLRFPARVTPPIPTRDAPRIAQRLHRILRRGALAKANGTARNVGVDALARDEQHGPFAPDAKLRLRDSRGFGSAEGLSMSPAKSAKKFFGSESSGRDRRERRRWRSWNLRTLTRSIWRRTLCAVRLKRSGVVHGCPSFARLAVVAGEDHAARFAHGRRLRFTRSCHRHRVASQNQIHHLPPGAMRRARLGRMPASSR
jgi:hypothetical protein